MSFAGTSRTWLTVLAGAAIAVAGCSFPGSNSVARRKPEPVIEQEDTNFFGGSGPRLKDKERLPLAYAKWQEQLGNLGEARESYEKVLSDSPKSADAILGLARIDHLAGRTAEARQGFERALELRPDDSPTLDAYAQFCLANKRYEKALELFHRAVESSPHTDIYRYHLAVALTRSGDPQAAMPHFVKTVGEAEAHYNIGYLLYEQGYVEEAENEFLRALMKNPDLAPAQALYEKIRKQRDDELMLAGHTNPPKAGASAQASESMSRRAAPGARRPSMSDRAASVANHDLSLEAGRGEVQNASHERYGADPFPTAGAAATANDRQSTAFPRY